MDVLFFLSWTESEEESFLQGLKISKRALVTEI